MNKTVASSCALVLLTIALFALPAAAQSPPYTLVQGEIGPGALYEIAMPTAPWNGELVVITHGMVLPGDTNGWTDIGFWRDTLTSQGFALIYSSYGKYSWAVKEGLQRTHQLRGVFASRFGAPARTYLEGWSMGGLIALMLAERFPDQYDGVLVDGGLVAGGPYEFSYLQDTRVLFDYFFPGVVPGTPFDVPPDLDFETVMGDVLAALLAGLDPALGSPTLQLGVISTDLYPAKLQYNDVGELIEATMWQVGFLLLYGNSVMEITNGHLAYGNTGTTYSGSADDAALNAGVVRYAADPSAAEYWRHYYTPTGILLIPVLTLHATRDPIAPIYHEQLFEQIVEGAGASQFLLQRTVDAFGHTGILQPDLEAGFADLVAWVRTGVKPPS